MLKTYRPRAAVSAAEESSITAGKATFTARLQPCDERISPADLVTYTREQYDRYSEISPLLSPDMFRARFASNEHYTGIAFPKEARGLQAIAVAGAQGAAWESHETEEANGLHAILPHPPPHAPRSVRRADTSRRILRQHGLEGEGSDGRLLDAGNG